MKLPRWFCSVSLGLFLVSSLGAEEAPARIAAWNVASGRNDTGGTPIPAERIDRLGKVIAEKIKPDVLVLEEVWAPDATAALAAAAKKYGWDMEGVNVPAQADGVVQLVTMIKRPGVEISEVVLIPGSEDLVDGDHPEEKSSRKAVQAKVKIGKFDFYLIGVHLKSKRPVQEITATPLEMRDRQVKAIAGRIQELTAGAEKDVLVIGDFNMTPKGEEKEGEESDDRNFQTLNASGQLHYLSSDVKGGTHVSFFRGQIHKSKLDGFAITKAAEKEYRPGSFRILDATALGAIERQFSDKRHAQFLTDHYALVAEFATTEDDD